MPSYFSRIFSSSPIRPLQQHMAKVVACVGELDGLFEAVIAEDWPRVERSQIQIAALEREADKLKKELRMHLPSSGLFMPMARPDLLEMLSMQDKVANRAKDIAGLVLGRRMALPEAIAQSYLEFVRRCIEAAEQAYTTVNELDELLETGFRGREVEVVKQMLERLDAIESETDRLQIEVRSRLFGVEKDLPAVDVMFLYRIIEWTGDLADRAQRVGSRLELMLAR